MDIDSARLLIVDDDQENRETLLDLLEPRGYSVTTAEDGESAVELIQNREFDVVLLDITMPGIDGFAVLERIRDRRCGSELPVIMVTGLGERDHVIRALEGGANDYVTKPLDLPVVLARLRTQLELKRGFDQILDLEHDLETRNAQLEAANKKIGDALEQMKGDLCSAASAQQALLPTSLPDIPGVEFAWAFKPCDDLAGDILDVYQLDDEHVAFYLLDVSGHGVRAALLSVTLSRILAPLPDQSCLVLRPRRSGPGREPTPPNIVAQELNRRFQLDLDTWQYFTLFYGVLNTKTHLLRYVSAGQPGPLHVPHGGDPVDLSLPIFAIGWVPNHEYIERRLQLRPGDRLYVYSDGAHETKNAEKEMFGLNRLTQAVKRGQESSLDDSLRSALSEAESFADQTFEDDVSAVAIEITGSPAITGSVGRFNSAGERDVDETCELTAPTRR